MVSCKYLYSMWSYLGGDVNLAFTWSVVPVVVAVIYAETAVFRSPHVLGGLVTKFLYFQLYLGGVYCVLVTTSFELVVPGEVSLMYSEVVCLCDGELDVSLPCWDDELFCFVFCCFHSLSDGGPFCA